MHYIYNNRNIISTFSFNINIIKTIIKIIIKIINIISNIKIILSYRICYDYNNRLTNYIVNYDDNDKINRSYKNDRRSECDRTKEENVYYRMNI